MKPTVVAALIGTTLLAAGCGKQAEPAHEEIRPVRSTAVGASAGSVGATYSGVVQARHESKLGFQSSGKIVARLVEVGAQVRRGQPLMRIDPEQQVLHVVAASADVDAAKSRVAQQRIEVQRTEQLLARQFASQAELDQNTLMLAEAESQLRSALARRQINVNQRGYTELDADRDGVVTAIGAEAGQVVSAGQQIVTLAGDGEREVVVSIPESRVDELRRAKSLQVSLWAQPAKTYTGTLRELAPDTDRVTRTYSARIAVEDADRALMLGMTASVFAPDVDGTQAIRLPLTAILDQHGQPNVWVVDAGSARVAPRAVRLGAVQNDAVIVTAGLASGETVVTAGVHMLHDGQRVKAAGAPASTTTVASGARP